MKHVRTFYIIISFINFLKNLHCNYQRANRKRVRRLRKRSPPISHESNNIAENGSSHESIESDNCLHMENETIDLVSVDSSDELSSDKDNLSDPITDELKSLGLHNFLASKAGGMMDVKTSLRYVKRLIHYLQYFAKKEQVPTSTNEDITCLIQKGFESMPTILVSYLQEIEDVEQYAPDTIRLVLEKLLATSRWFFLFSPSARSEKLSTINVTLISQQMSELALRLRRQYKKATLKLRKLNGKDTMEYKV